MAGCCSGTGCHGAAMQSDIANDPRPPSSCDSCCADSSVAIPSKLATHTKPIFETSDDCRDAPSCDDSESAIVPIEPVSPASSASPVPESGACSGKSCCASKFSNPSEIDSQLYPKNEGKASSTIITIDLDDGRVERVVLSVQGMDCTGCGRELHAALNSIKDISNIKTNATSGLAEFDLLVTGSTSTEDVMRTVEKKTGFKCSRNDPVGADLELIYDPDREKLPHLSPAGISLRFHGRDRLFLSYNPRMIAIRSLLAHPYFEHMKLAPPRTVQSISSSRARLWRSFWTTLLSVALTIPVLVVEYGKFPQHRILSDAICLFLATVVQFVIAGPFYVKAFKTLMYARMVEMDMLVVLSSTAAYVYSIVAFSFHANGRPLDPDSFFETSTLLVTLIMIGRLAADYSRQKAVESISIESLQTSTAMIQNAKTMQEEEIDSRLLQYDDVFKVLPEMTIVTDGIILVGETEVDESLITGEATFVHKKPRSPVIAGSINQHGVLWVQVTRLPSENTIKTISTMVDAAKSTKPKVQDIADRIACHFTPAILVITIAVFTIWVAIGIQDRKESWGIACIHAMIFAISTLIVSCPCAIGLAVPMVVLIAGGVSARHGLILKSAETIEIAREISHVVFDKTGTLTEGRLTVVDERYFGSEEPEAAVSTVALGLAASSQHPVAVAITKHLTNKGINFTSLDSIISVPGNGIEAIWNGVRVRAGNQFWLGVEDSPVVRSITESGGTVFCVTMNDRLIAVFDLKDQIRSDALETVQKLQARGISISLISGDHEGAVNLVASRLKISGRSRCTPASKAEYIKSLVDEGKTVLFVGDGTNDAVALAQASIGLHMNTGTDVAQSAADAVLMRPSLTGVLTLIDLSRASHRRVLFNFGWSLVYNLFAILLAAGAFEATEVKASIPPQYAGLGELVSVLPVMLVAVSLRWVKF